ncbi:MAG: glycosyltransferase [Carnobacterium sp.]|nr:glycosyltransferase [Carnobacterium sp.]
MSSEFIWMMCTSILVMGVGLWALALKFPAYRKGIMIFYAIFQVFYLLWRITYTIPVTTSEGTLFGTLLVFIELSSFAQTAIFILLFSKEKKAAQVVKCSSDFIPSVDIFIATYNEEVELLEKTVVAAKLAEYPEEKRVIYLCDDGNRSEIKELAEKWSIQYLSRPDNKGAKAGNLNYGLLHSTGEFVVTMDADMMMKSNFLKEIMPLFQDEKMGFVQTPQAFHNPDVFQHNLYVESNVRNDQDFFMRFLQPAKNKFNAVIYVGSNAVFRRSALDSVNGFVTDVITEDMATGLLIQNEGWKSEFLNKVLATGLSPETFQELIKQRVRWAKGNIQVAKKYSPRKLSHLSFIQKLLYVDGVHYWFFGVYHFLYMMFPILSVLLGIQLVESPSSIFLPLWLASYILSNLVFSSVAGKEFRPMWASVGELAIFPHIAWAVFQEVIGQKTKVFAVTTKGQTIEKTTFHWKMMFVQLIFLGLSLASLGIIVTKMIANPVQMIVYWAVPFFWLTYNVLCLIGALHISIDRKRYKNQLVSCGSSAVLKYKHTTIPIRITKIHAGKAIIKISDKQSNLIKVGEEWTMEVETGLSLPICILTSSHSVQSQLYSVKVKELDKQTYLSFFEYLDQLNTEKFKKRKTNYKHPIYHLTLGYYMAKFKVKEA